MAFQARQEKPHEVRERRFGRHTDEQLVRAIAWLLSNMVLMTLGHPPLTANEENRLAYSGALDAFNYAAELAPLEEFFMVETLTSRHGGQHSEKK